MNRSIKYGLSKLIVFVFTLFPLSSISAQSIETKTITSIRGSYTICNGKIYEGTEVDSSKFVATIKGNQMFKLNSLNPKDVLFTVVKGKVYRTSDITLKNLLFYTKGKEIYLRTKKDTFESAGFFTKDANGDYTLASFLEPLEYFVFEMAARETDIY